MLTARRRLLLVALASVAASATACAPAATATPRPLETFPRTTIRLGELELRVAVAETEDERRQGLQGVDGLVDLHGMLFVFDADTDTSFTMRGVLLPLDIAFIGADGRVIAVERMAVCRADPCATYRSPLPFRWALEVPTPGLEGTFPGDELDLEPQVGPT